MTKRDQGGQDDREMQKIRGDTPTRGDRDPYGDDQGTMVGHPSTPHRDNAEPSEKKGARGEQGRSTGAGNEAAAGIHGSNGGGAGSRPGSEPLEGRENEHTSGYGGEGGAPRTSADQR